MSLWQTYKERKKNISICFQTSLAIHISVDNGMQLEHAKNFLECFYYSILGRVSWCISHQMMIQYAQITLFYNTGLDLILFLTILILITDSLT